MRVIKLPKGSTARKLSCKVDGEVTSVDFNKKGIAKVSNEKADIICRAFPALTVEGEKAKEPDTSPADNIEESEDG